jgi:hypothetical protein
MLVAMTRMALLCSLVALVLVPAALGRGREDGPRELRGVVQAVAPRELELRTLDGATTSVRTNARTRVAVNGRRAGLLAVASGFVAVVELDDRGVARRIEAFGEAAPSEASPSGKQGSSPSGEQGKPARGRGSRHGDRTR